MAGDFINAPSPAEAGQTGKFINAPAPNTGQFINAPGPIPGGSYTSKYQDDIVAQAMKYGIKPSALLAIHRIEDAQDDPNATSSTGHKGLFQMSKDAWKQAGGANPAEITNPQKNIEFAAKYFRQLLDQNKGDYEKAVQHFGDQTPQYLQKYNQFAQQYNDVQLSETHRPAPVTEAGIALPPQVTKMTTDVLSGKAVVGSFDKEFPQATKAGRQVSHAMADIAQDHPNLLQHIDQFMQSGRRGLAGMHDFMGKHQDEPYMQRLQDAVKQGAKWGLDPHYQTITDKIDRDYLLVENGGFLPKDSDIDKFFSGPQATLSRTANDVLSQVLLDPYNLIPFDKALQGLRALGTTGVAAAKFVGNLGPVANYLSVMAKMGNAVPGMKDMTDFAKATQNLIYQTLAKRPDLDKYFNERGKKTFMGIVTGTNNAHSSRTYAFKRTAADLQQLNEHVAEMFKEHGDPAVKAAMGNLPTGAHLAEAQRLVAAKTAARKAATDANALAKKAAVQAKGWAQAARKTPTGQANATAKAAQTAAAAQHLAGLAQQAIARAKAADDAVGHGVRNVEKYMKTLQDLAQFNPAERIAHLETISDQIAKEQVMKASQDFAATPENIAKYLSPAMRDTINLLGMPHWQTVVLPNIPHNHTVGWVQMLNKGPIGQFSKFTRNVQTKSLAWSNPFIHPVKNVGTLSFLRAPGRVAGGARALIQGLAHGFAAGPFAAVGKNVSPVFTKAHMDRLSRIGGKSTYYHDALPPALNTLATANGPRAKIGVVAANIYAGLERLASSFEDGYRASMLQQLDRNLGKSKDDLHEFYKGQIINERVGDYSNLNALVQAFRAFGGPFVAFHLGIVPGQVAKSLLEYPTRYGNMVEAEIDQNQELKKGGSKDLWHELGGAGTDFANLVQDIMQWKPLHYLVSESTLGPTYRLEKLSEKMQRGAPLTTLLVDGMMDLLETVNPGFNATMEMLGVNSDYDMRTTEPRGDQEAENLFGSYPTYPETTRQRRMIDRGIDRNP